MIKPASWNRIQYNVTSIMSALKNYGVLAIAMDVQDSFMSYRYHLVTVSSACAPINVYVMSIAVPGSTRAPTAALTTLR